MIPHFEFREYIRIIKAAASTEGGPSATDLELLHILIEQHGWEGKLEVKGLCDPSPIFLVEITPGELSEVTRRASIREAVLLAVTSGNMDKRRPHIVKLAQKLMLDESFVAKSEDWSRRYLELIREGRALFNE
ncbi:MAG: hypothetical protein PHQ23_02075 [Candidatus Wallbacteria bacterium]|nr:hypothetical protein [Candidatus Wallbacteria bacterium]